MPPPRRPIEYPPFPADSVAEAMPGTTVAPPFERRTLSPTQAYGSLERAFAASGLIAALGTAVGGVLVARGYGWPALAAATSVALLLCACTGIWAHDQVVRFQRGEVALIYATALQGPRRALFDRRKRDPTRMESLGMVLADCLDSLRLTVLGTDSLTRWAMDMRRILVDRSQTTEKLAAALGEDAHAIAAAANASRRAEADIAADIGDMFSHASRATIATADMHEEAMALAVAVRQVTAQTSQAAAIAAKLADTVFAATNGVAAVTEVTISLGQAADQVKAVLQRAEMLGINAGIEAARAGDSGRGFAVVAAEVKNLATSGGAALDGMLQIVRGLKSEAAAMRHTVQSIGDTIEAQSALGLALADAASHQAQSVGRVVQQVETAHAEIVSLRDRAHEMESRDLGMGTGPAARKAVERLPAHAEAVAAILRDLPQFADKQR
jgi:methyl-accepting chemotaxis protein